MTLSPLVPRSFTAQVLLTFVAFVSATVAALTVLAYQSSRENLLTNAHSDTAIVAVTRGQLLTESLRSRQRRANGLLTGVELVCAEPGGPQGLSWEFQCVMPMVAEFRRSERAAGVILTVRGTTISSFGERLPPPVAEDGWQMLETGDGQVDFLLAVARGDARLVLRFDSSEVVAPLTEYKGGLGASGEVFLIDESGRPLMPLRFGVPEAPLEREARFCRAANPPQTVEGYAGRVVIPGFYRPEVLPELCVVAHMSYAEALAPAADLRRQLAARGVAFILGGVLLSLLAARFIASPVKRLASAARSLQEGDLRAHVPVTGPSEVRDLGRALRAMAASLADLLAREQSLRREAEAANRSKDQFLAMLSHELRTPLTAVLGWAHTLRTSEVDAGRVRRAATAIERSAEAQRRLIEDLLDITGIAAGRVRIDRAPTRLAAILEAAIDAVRPRADEKRIQLTTVVEDDTLTVFADAQRLQQVFWNLLWNAIKFTPEGGRVDVQVRSLVGLAQITVADTGIGIDPEFLPHVFGWFRRADRDVRTTDEGLGLGLALVRQLVELHDGAVTAESPGKGRGATFVVTLPLPSGEDADVTRDDRGRRLSAELLGSLHVLVVDDDPASRETVRVLLEQAGAHVSTAASAADARQHLRSAPTDVLISDIAMAQESGYSLVQSLRAQGFTRPAIALTAYARREDAERAYAAGFDVHLPKPVDPEVLVNVLVAAVSRNRTV